MILNIVMKYMKKSQRNGVKDIRLILLNKKKGATMIPKEDIISIVKNTITASIKCNTYRGYIGWSSCDNICMDMHDCLDMCAETLEMSGYMVALEGGYIYFGIWC